jgi:hypothetical protein
MPQLQGSYVESVLETSEYSMADAEVHRKAASVEW